MLNLGLVGEGVCAGCGGGTEQLPRPAYIIILFLLSATILKFNFYYATILKFNCYYENQFLSISTFDWWLEAMVCEDKLKEQEN